MAMSGKLKIACAIAVLLAIFLQTPPGKMVVFIAGAIFIDISKGMALGAEKYWFGKIYWQKEMAIRTLAHTGQTASLHALSKLGVMEHMLKNCGQADGKYCDAATLGRTSSGSPLDTENLNLILASLGTSGILEEAPVQSGHWRLNKHIDAETVHAFWVYSDYIVHVLMRQAHVLHEAMEKRTYAGGLDIVQPDWRTDRELKYPSLYAAAADYPEKIFKPWKRLMDFVTLEIDDVWMPQVPVEGSLLEIAGQTGQGMEKYLKYNDKISRGVIFDLPFKGSHVIERFMDAGHNVTFVGGNIFDPEPIPHGPFDTVSIKHFLDMWSYQEQTQILRKAFDTLRTGGKLILVHSHLRDDWAENIECVPCALLPPYMITTQLGWGGTTKKHKMFELLQAAGFNGSSISATWVNAVPGAADPSFAPPGKHSHELVVTAFK